MTAAPAANVVDERMKAAFTALWNDGELGPAVQAFTKKLIPDAKTDADVIDPHLAPLRQENKKLAEKLERIEADRAEERKAADEARTKHSLESMLEAARKNYALTEEGFDKMVARMKETGNFSDADAAAAWVASKAPPANVKGPTFGPRRMNLFGVGKHDEQMKSLHGDPVQFIDDQLEEWAADPAKYVAETLGTAA